MKKLSSTDKSIIVRNFHDIEVVTERCEKGYI